MILALQKEPGSQEVVPGDRAVLDQGEEKKRKGKASLSVHRGIQKLPILTFPPRKTWYHTEVPPKSMWKSVKQPFTLIRQYLQVQKQELGAANASQPQITGGEQSLRDT